MKQILKLFILLSLFALSSCATYAQCADSSDASLDETKEWIVNKINSIGGRILPPTKYISLFNGDQFTVYELGIDSNLDLKDTLYCFQIEIQDIDLNKLAIREISKNGRFGLSIESLIGSSKLITPIVGPISGVGFEIILQSDDPNMSKRITKALKHAVCIVSSDPAKKIKSKEKF